MKRLTLLCMAVLALGLLVACGGGDDDDAVGDDGANGGQVDDDGRDSDDGDSDDGDSGGADDPDSDGGSDDGPQGTTKDLEAAALAQFEYFLEGDFQSYYQTIVRSCREEAGWSGVHEDRRSRRTLARQFNDIDLEQVSVAAVIIDGFNGRGAMVTLEIEGPEDTTSFRETRANPWVFDEGAWRWADCEDFLSPNPPFPTGSQNDPLTDGAITIVAHWFVNIRGVEPKEDEFLMEEPGYQPPAAGTQYFRVLVDVQYDGPEVSATLGEDLEFALVAGRREYDADKACGLPAGYEIELDTEVIPGEGTRGDVCREIDPSPTAEPLCS